jgi:hypothetical protein
MLLAPMEQHNLKLSSIIEGATEKISQFKMLFKLIYSTRFCFSEQNVFLEDSKKVKAISNLYINNIFKQLNSSVYLFRVAL